MTMTSYNHDYKTGCPQIDDWIDDVRSGKVRTNGWIKKATDLILKELSADGVVIQQERIDRAIELGERYFYPLFPWQKMVIALMHCIHEPTDTLVWGRYDLVMGRGAGKNGFISCVAWYLTTPDHGVRGYHVDMVANSQEQAERSFEDVYGMLDAHAQKMRKQFEWTKTRITNLKTESYIQFNTSNAKTKDSRRPGCLVFDEYHGYENYEQIKVFTSGLGKVKHSRQFWISSFGNVRGGVFDQELQRSRDILDGKRKAFRRMPLLWHLEDESQLEDHDNWEMANPSLRYLPELRAINDEQYEDAKDQPELMLEFKIKRMGLTGLLSEVAVTSWANLMFASRELPDLRGRECVFGIDFAKTTDFVSAGLLFRDGDTRYWLKKTWVCKQSADIPRIKAPLDVWHELGYIELVDDVEISPKRVASWLQQMQRQYHIVGGGLDSYRYTLMAEALADIGYEPKRDLRLIRGTTIMQTAPVITSAFATGNIAFGDDEEMRWSVNNAKQISFGRDRDIGNYTFGKQEPKSRKTDSFMAMVAAFCCEDMLSGQSNMLIDLGSFTW